MLKKNTKIGALKGLVVAGFIGACSVSVSQGAVIMSINQVGGDVVMTATGTLDISLVPARFEDSWGVTNTGTVRTDNAYYNYVGPSHDYLRGSITWVATGSPTISTSYVVGAASGDNFGVWLGNSSVWVEDDYVSGTAIRIVSRGVPF